jgi:probable F420-dependent oxidoreductase
MRESAHEGDTPIGNLQVDTTLTKDIAATGRNAAAAEAEGYDGVWVSESSHEPFLRLVQAADHTERVAVGTAVAIAFARTPLVVASAGYDLQMYAQGRFVLGLGSQVRAHVERRFSMPWSNPAARMREFVLALRAIWDSWEHGTKLEFRGDYYTHTLMTPFFSPPVHQYGPPPVFLAGVGEMMTEVAGETADGFFVHPFSTDRYLREVTLPALRRGRERAGKDPADFVLVTQAFTCTGRDEVELAAAKKATKARIAFYASTPAYRRVLDLHGWGELGDELNGMTKQGRWDELGDLIDDEVLHTFAAVGEPEDVGEQLRHRFGSVVQRLSFYATYQSDPSIWPIVLDAVRAAG